MKSNIVEFNIFELLFVGNAYFITFKKKQIYLLYRLKHSQSTYKS
jgi:hypothetical protein